MGMYDRDWAREGPPGGSTGDGFPRWAIYLFVAMFVLAGGGYFFGNRWMVATDDFPSPFNDTLYAAIVGRDASEVGKIAKGEPERLLKPIGEAGETDLPLLVAVEYGGKEVVDALLKNGAKPNVKGRGGRTALHCAAATGDEDMVRLLIKNGADVSARDDVGFTPLFDAAQCGGNPAVGVAKVLVDAGADCSAATVDGQTPLKIAEHEGNLRMVSFLKQAASSGKRPKKKP